MAVKELEERVQQAIEVLKLEPGDRLVLRLPVLTGEQQDQIIETVTLIEQKWGIGIMVITGEVELTVIREEAL